MGVRVFRVFRSQHQEKVENSGCPGFTSRTADVQARQALPKLFTMAFKFFQITVGGVATPGELNFLLVGYCCGSRGDWVGIPYEGGVKEAVC